MSPSLPRDVPQSINGSSESPSAISDPFAQSESSPCQKNETKKNCCFVPCQRQSSYLTHPLIVGSDFLFTASQPSSEQDGTTAVEAQAPAGRRNNLPVSPPTRSHLPSSTVLQDGYDSDVGINQNEAIAMEGPLEVEEAELGEVSEVGDALAVANNPTNNAANNAEQPTVVLIPDDKIKKMKVSELKLELSKRGLSNKGLKQALLDRLKQAMTDRVPVLSEQQRTEQEEEHVSGFSATARWKPLVPLEEVVEEPTNVTRSLRPPTVPEEDNDFVAQKHNFQESFDRAPFLGEKKVPKCHRNGHQMKDSSTNQPLWNDEVDVKGGPRAEWILEQGLSSASHPADWFDAFLPVYDGTTRTPSHSNTPFWTHRWANYLNMKASQMGAGVMGGIYPDFRPFTFDDIERHIGLYILQGLNPSPQINQKFQSQARDPVQGNDLCFRAFGANATRRHQHFKAFFCVQDPTKIAPSRKKRPNYKVDPVLRHVQDVSQAAWRLGRDISGDEQTIGFQGKHTDKLRITYKAEGDGFQCDALCDSGYTWTFYFRNQPAPRHYLREGYSPLHSRILGLFDQLEEKNHNCWFDNLYLSAKFCRAAFVHEKSVRISGPTRKAGRGLPKCVMQEEVNNPTELRRVRGTVKAAVLVGDSAIPNLVAVSYYNQKPVHFLSTICESIRWVQCEKKVYCVETEQMEVVKFLCLNINNDYNHDMGNVDIADQLRNYYRFDHWMRKRKWWWALFFWAIGILLVNCYLCYKHYMISIGKTPISQSEFRKAIALAWIDWPTYWPDRMARGKNQSNNSRTNKRGRLDDDNGGRLGTSAVDGGGSGAVSSSSRPARTRRTTLTSGRSTAAPSLSETGEGDDSTGANTRKKKRAKRSPPITAQSLDCRTGALRIRLENRRGAHLPEESGKGLKCALHNFVLEERTRKQILKCGTCGVHLCIPCFKLFHTIEEVPALQQAVIDNWMEENENKTQVEKV